MTTYHLEAAIACVHALAPSARETDWGAIVRIYDALLALRPSPVVALQRAIAVGQHEGPDRGLAAIAAHQRARAPGELPVLRRGAGRDGAGARSDGARPGSLS